MWIGLVIAIYTQVKCLSVAGLLVNPCIFPPYLTGELMKKSGKWLHFEEAKVTAFPHSGVFPMRLNLINTCMLESCIPTHYRGTAAPYLAVSHFCVQTEIQTEE